MLDGSEDFDDSNFENEPEPQSQYSSFENWLAPFSINAEDWSLADFFDSASGFLLNPPANTSSSNMSGPQNPPPPPQNVIINYYKVEFRDRDRFNGQHFDIWMIRVRSKLQELQLWEVVTGTEVKPLPTVAADVIKAWDLKDLKARNVI